MMYNEWVSLGDQQ